jgi:hypothetical protein
VLIRILIICCYDNFHLLIPSFSSYELTRVVILEGNEISHVLSKFTYCNVQHYLDTNVEVRHFSSCKF